jgi:hypothetical protein
MVIGSLTMGVYHNICILDLSPLQRIFISTSENVKPGAIQCSHYSDNPLEDPIEIASAPNLVLWDFAWQTSVGATGVVIEDGWTRYFILSLQ